jgi:hypothetical protein
MDISLQHHEYLYTESASEVSASPHASCKWAGRQEFVVVGGAVGPY